MMAMVTLVAVLFIFGMVQAGVVTVTVDGTVGPNVLFNNTSGLFDLNGLTT